MCVNKLNGKKRETKFVELNCALFKILITKLKALNFTFNFMTGNH